MQSKQFFIIFLIFGLKDSVSKLSIRLSFDLSYTEVC